MALTRRQFSQTAIGALAGLTLFNQRPAALLASILPALVTQAPTAQADSRTQVADGVDIAPRDADELQKLLFDHRDSGRVLRLSPATELTCPDREDVIQGEKSTHPLLIPSGVTLDLNGSTLRLSYRSNAYGIRLSNDSGIRNGTIRIVSSENKGSQACWHSAVCVGAAYGDGGTPDRPGAFTKVRNWTMEDLTIDQPFPAACIQLMSEACHGVIRNIRIADSAKALLGIAMDWGGVGPLTSEDARIPEMQMLWKKGDVYTTHPHHVRVENVRVGRLTRNVDGNDAGVRCSACHEIEIRNVHVSEAASAVAIFGGDLGYEFAREDPRLIAHRNYRIEDVTIGKALKYGIVLNGMADNVWRAMRDYKYQPNYDPTLPGLLKATLRRVNLQGPGANTAAQGLYAICLTDAQLDQCRFADFRMGVHLEDWVQGMTLTGTQFERNGEDRRIEGATSPARDIVFRDSE